MLTNNEKQSIYDKMADRFVLTYHADGSVTMVPRAWFAQELAKREAAKPWYLQPSIANAKY